MILGHLGGDFLYIFLSIFVTAFWQLTCLQFHTSFSLFNSGVGGMRRKPLNPPPPLRGAGRVGSFQTLACSCQTPEPLLAPPRPADLHYKSPFADPQNPNLRFLTDFLPIKNPSKIGLLKTPPKITKIRAWIAKCRFLMDFGSHFGINFRSDVRYFS